MGVPMQQEEIVHIPKLVPQERISHQPVEQVVDVPVPMTQEEIVHVPVIQQEHRHHHVHVDHHVDVHVPHEQEEIVHVPVIQTQERIVQNPKEIIVEVPRPSVVEKTIEVPKVVIEEKTIKVPKVHNTVVHTNVQNQVQTIEVEKPRIIQKVVHRKKPIIQ